MTTTLEQVLADEDIKLDSLDLLVTEEDFDRRFRRLRVDALREFAAAGCEESAKRLRWELNEWRLDNYEDIRVGNIETPPLPKRPYRQLGSRQRALVFRYFGRKCGICAREDGFFEIDHKIPWSRGGTHAWDNLWVLCATCNREKAALTVEEYLEAREANKECLPS